MKTDLDPSYSLLFESPAGCNLLLDKKHTNTTVLVAVIVPVVVLAVLAMLTYLYFGNKISSWWSLSRAKRNAATYGEFTRSDSTTQGLRTQSSAEMDELTIERRAPMQIHTAAGRFSVKLN